MNSAKNLKKIKNHNNVNNLVIAAFFAAIIFLTTYLIKVPIITGYGHIGDTFIYLAACILPSAYACSAAAIGAALADGIGGYPLYIIPSVIIKALTALMFTSKSQKIISKRNFFAFIPSIVLCAGGYYISEVILYQSFVSPVASLPRNIAQPVLSLILFTLIGFALDKSKFKQKI